MSHQSEAQLEKNLVNQLIKRLFYRRNFKKCMQENQPKSIVALKKQIIEIAQQHFV